ncbi:hypothetical protein XYCOK13_00730 [Xylanibacillus composti]|uniref:Uncharacterized protein n=1 Tax=Xylanibacillus composti TaxID=1572762 RepID=A0A8J4M0B0_9BACL|nr:hypothetical protein XYCOK13_00730 [Xylanibacillus composti]
MGIAQAIRRRAGLPNVIGVPHIGALSGYWKPRMGELVAEDLVRFAQGEPVQRLISYEKFKRMTPL